MKKKKYDRDSAKLKGPVMYIGNNKSQIIEALQAKGVTVVLPVSLYLDIKQQSIRNQSALYQCACLYIDDGYEDNPTSVLLIHSAKIAEIPVDDYATHSCIQSLKRAVEEHTGVPFASMVGRLKGKWYPDARRMFVGIAFHHLRYSRSELVEMLGANYKNADYDIRKFDDCYSVDARFRETTDKIIAQVKEQTKQQL